jgi:glycosyltransferase involved in cell wall biosynthesis
VPLDVLVSIITPAYNVERWIGESIDSALQQTESRFELIVVDDGSTDGTPDIVRPARQPPTPASGSCPPPTGARPPRATRG